MKNIVAAIEANGDKEVMVIDTFKHKVLVHWYEDRSYVIWTYDKQGNLSLGKYFKYFSLLPKEQVQAMHDAYAIYCECE